MFWKQIFISLEGKKDLSKDQIDWCLSQILEGRATQEYINNLFSKLHTKGESVQEIEATLSHLKKYSSPINIPERTIYTVGTGESLNNSLNIATLAAIVTNAAGARVVISDNPFLGRSSDSAEILQTLGVKVDLTAGEIEQSIHKIGIGFYSKQLFDSSLNILASNILASEEEENLLATLKAILNPFDSVAIAIGTARSHSLQKFAHILSSLGKEGFVFKGDDDTDKVSLATSTTVIQISKGKLKMVTFNPSDIGVSTNQQAIFPDQDLKLNLQLIHQAFAGKSGPVRDLITLNAALSIAAFKADFDIPVEAQLANGFVLANKAIDSGAVQLALNRWIKMSNELVSAR